MDCSPAPHGLVPPGKKLSLFSLFESMCTIIYTASPKGASAYEYCKDPASIAGSIRKDMCEQCSLPKLNCLINELHMQPSQQKVERGRQQEKPRDRQIIIRNPWVVRWRRKMSMPSHCALVQSWREKGLGSSQRSGHLGRNDRMHV